jgi:2-(1,2-epoxy-1,2-dihydrophenyl)acetyl-CoA isomerase
MSTTISTPLQVAQEGGVLTLTLHRPDKLNSLDISLLKALGEAITEAREDESVRAVVITGSGRGFSAGADLTEGDREGVRRRLSLRYEPIIRTMREMEKPVIAAVNGVAAGAGMSLTLAADLRIAAESASFLLAFARIGLIPDAGATFMLPRLVGLGRAMELAMLAEQISAAEALRIGLVNRVVPDAELAGTAQELAQRLARGPFSLGLIKRAMNLSLVSDLHTQLQHEEDLQGLAFASADFGEGVRAFVEKRPAKFEGH